MSKLQTRKKKLTNIYLPKKKGKTPLKRSMSGYEIECFVLNNDGSLDHSGKFIGKVQKKDKAFKKECAKAMIETVCIPSKKLRVTSLDLVNNLLKLSDLAQKDEKLLYPFSTYPGINKPVFRKSIWFKSKQKILGKNFVNAGLCCGFHQHYTLPRGVFNHSKRFLKYNLQSKVKRTMLDSYNLLNSIDPILTAFLQSSPYANNKHIAKDSRLILYRGGEKLGYKQGLYGNLQFFGALSPYKQTLEDLLSTIKRKYKKWNALLIQNGFTSQNYLSEKNILKFSWNPVKINPLGTLEYRGGDTNYLSIIMSVSTMINAALRKIQQDFLLVIPMDIDLKDAFRIEGNLLFIPPHTLVRKKLQYNSAYQGLRNKDIFTYSRAFFNFVKKEVADDYKSLLDPIIKMLETRETMSDKIIKKVKRKGYNKEIPQEVAQELALYYAKKYVKDLHETKDMLLKVGH